MVGVTRRQVDYGLWASDTKRLASGGGGAEPTGFVAVCRLHAGRARLRAGRDSLVLDRGDVFVMADGDDELSAERPGTGCTVLRIPVDALHEAAGRVSPHPTGTRLAFLSRRPVTTAAGRRFAQVASFAGRHLDDAGPTVDPVFRAAVGNLLAATVLETFPNSLTPESSSARPRTDVSTTVGLALDFIARNADLPIRATDIAAHAMVSTRALQMAFREHLATSPARYLRSYRMARVHEELAAATAGDGTAVTQVATRWTFTESSRFAAHYRRVYGELPSQTLRRGPRPLTGPEPRRAP